MLAAHRSGKSKPEVAEQFGVGVATVTRLLRLVRESGDVAPRPRGGGNRPKISEDQYGELMELVASQPDATREELCAAWERIYGVSISTAAMGRTLRKADITWKKNGSGRGRYSVKKSRSSADGT